MRILIENNTRLPLEAALTLCRSLGEGGWRDAQFNREDVIFHVKRHDLKDNMHYQFYLTEEEISSED